MMSSAPVNASVLTERTPGRIRSRRWATVVLTVGIGLGTLTPATGIGGAVVPSPAGHVSASWAAHPDCIVCVM